MKLATCIAQPLKSYILLQSLQQTTKLSGKDINQVLKEEQEEEMLHNLGLQIKEPLIEQNETSTSGACMHL